MCIYMPEPSNTKSFDAKVSYPLSKKLSKLLHKNKKYDSQ